jgi:hypothetical protein
MTLSKADIKLIQKTITETSNQYREKELQDLIKYLLIAALGFAAGMVFGAF